MNTALNALSKIQHLQSSVDAQIEQKLSQLSDEDLRATVEDFLLSDRDTSRMLTETFTRMMPVDTGAMLGSVYLRVYLRRMELAAMEQV